MTQKPCIFCKLLEKKDVDIIVEEGNDRVAIKIDVKPRSKSHFLVITRKHYSNIEEVQALDWGSMLPLIKSYTSKINKVFQPVGYNIAIYGGKKSFQTIKAFSCSCCS